MPLRTSERLTPASTTPYAEVVPIESPISAERQSARRHYGVHPYFTRRPHNVVREYVLHYSRVRDRVLDPFGGSGVTAIEAFLENRTGIQNDINPLANFIAKGIVGLREGDLADYRDAIKHLATVCEEKLTRIDGMATEGLQVLLGSLALPGNIRLPKSSDVDFYHELFTPRQLASLAVLKQAIDGLPDTPAKQGMLLAWSAALTKLNHTFLSAEGRAKSRGGSSIFSIYRYKVAKEPVELPSWHTFEERAQNIVHAKQEIDKLIRFRKRTGAFVGSFEKYELDIEELSERLAGKIDYIFTDPPYGGHISYLDLSILWNHWLGNLPSVQVRKKELIVGGELSLPESAYTVRLGDSIRACLKMLKPGRWLSVVFQHWNVAYFEAMLSSADSSGAELKAAISQVGDPIWSMHKKKGHESVLAGEMILTFLKTGKARSVSTNGQFDVAETVQTILSTANGRIYGEQLFNQVVVEAWKKSAIGSLNIKRTDFVSMIAELGWHYDQQSHCWVKEQPVSVTLF